MSALWDDQQQLDQLLSAAADVARDWLSALDTLPAAAIPADVAPEALPGQGRGAAYALERFRERYLTQLSASPGPRYWGYVTGGATPAALAGEWLCAALDQNVAQQHDSAAAQLEREAIAMLLALFGLPSHFHGYFVSGATMSNFTGLAAGRQWVGVQQGVDVAEAGAGALPLVPVLAGSAHASTRKALSMLGLGRQSLLSVPCLAGREAVDPRHLREALRVLEGRPAIVVASGGTVNSVDFDDIAALAALKAEFPFWLHVDAAFGGFAACSPDHASLLRGWEAADSITVDAHKWLNVPYDSAMIFTPHPELLHQVFRNQAAYLGEGSGVPDPVHMTPQNSRRFRALAAWFTLVAYGADGYREIVERQVRLARLLGTRIEHSDRFRLLAPVRLNVVCFALAAPGVSRRDAFLSGLQRDGTVFLTPTTLDGTPGMRAAFSNWQTRQRDVDRAWTAIEQVAASLA